jgi:hypothetical protein
MNKLQTFMARGNALTRAVNQEPVEINGAVYYGTFGDPQLQPLQTRHGSADYLVTELKISKVQFGADPVAKQTIRRPNTRREFFVQVVDTTHPVVYTFILTDREI